MKLVTFSKKGSISCGILKDGGIIDIKINWPDSNPPYSVKEILERGSDCFEKLLVLAELTENLISAETVEILAPVVRPGKVIALAGNYSEHIEEVGKEMGMSYSPRQVTTLRPFLMPGTVVVGTGREIAWPAYSREIDYEIELAVVIGKKAKCIAAENASGFIGGYTIANDVSARSVTFTEGRAERPWDNFYDWLNGKWADGFLPMGPYLVTPDKIADVQKLDMTLKVNGEVRQDSNTSRMIYNVAEIVSFVSHLMTLEAGDVIATGTPAGVAKATGNYLKAGDIIDCTIEKLGSLTNILGPKPKTFYEPLGH